jgi:hypothetical protein
MTDPLALLNSPLAVPGSGRVRYGAAMALWREGRISAEVLEVYRIASAHDGRDPRADLRDRGLPLPPVPAPAPVLEDLYRTARDYLFALDHPGAEEVRASLPPEPGPLRAMTPRPNPVVEAWLGPALAAVQGADPLRQAIAAARDRLDWITYDGYPPEEIGAEFAGGHAFASILGGDAPFPAMDVDMGLFLIAPGVLYRDHRHLAPELYAPLTGPHGWRFGTGRPLIAKPAHRPVWNPPLAPHLTLVGRVPFLALFVWTRDVDNLAEVIPADDWAELREVPSD